MISASNHLFTKLLQASTLPSTPAEAKSLSLLEVGSAAAHVLEGTGAQPFLCVFFLGEPHQGNSQLWLL